MAEARKTYQHHGWLGEPCESDFQSHWGLVRREEMYDGRALSTATEAAQRARDAGYGYLLAPKPSRHGNHLYKVVGKGPPYCVYVLLEAREREAAHQRARYAEGARSRLTQTIRVVAGTKYREALLERLDEIMARVEAGTCEFSGSPFGERGLAPTITRIDRRKGFTYDNVMVVTTIAARLTNMYPRDEIETFARSYVERLSERT